MSENLDLHNNDLAMIRYRGFDRDFISILVFALVTLNIYRERRRGNETTADKKNRFGKLGN